LEGESFKAVTTPALPIQGRVLSKEVEGDVIEALRGGKKTVDQSVSPIAPSRGKMSLTSAPTGG
jgi:hypothetical protein